MAKRRWTKPTHLVIDASVGRAAGGPETQHPTGAHCRDVLSDILACDDYRLCQNTVWYAEWNKHASQFATRWYRTMFVRKRVRHLSDNEDDEVRHAVANADASDAHIDIMEKDVHLIEMALEEGRRIVSLDDEVRGLFAIHLHSLKDVRAITWVNPDKEFETTRTWLAKRAPHEKSMCLGEFGR